MINHFSQRSSNFGEISLEPIGLTTFFNGDGGSLSWRLAGAAASTSNRSGGYLGFCRAPRGV
jgi:hypothetical protein